MTGLFIPRQPSFTSCVTASAAMAEKSLDDFFAKRDKKKKKEKATVAVNRGLAKPPENVQSTMVSLSAGNKSMKKDKASRSEAQDAQQMKVRGGSHDRDTWELACHCTWLLPVMATCKSRPAFYDQYTAGMAAPNTYDCFMCCTSVGGQLSIPFIFNTFLLSRLTNVTGFMNSNIQGSSV